MKIERKFAPVAEIKFATDEATMEFEGYASKFNGVNSYGDRIAPGAYADTLKEYRSKGFLPPMLSQHGSFVGGDDNMPIGVWKDMREDSAGLFVKGQLADTPRGREAHTLLKMGALTGMSIGFQPVAWEMRARPEDPRRTLTKIRLIEVSLVSVPADDKARVTAVKAVREMTIREFEAALESGTLPALSKKEAMALLSDGFKGLSAERDAGDEGDELAALIRRNITLLKR